MYRIAVIDQAENALGFKALGLDVFPAADAGEAARIVERLAAEDYAVIYLAEHLAEGMKEIIDRYSDRIRPAIVLIPGPHGGGLGMAALRSAVERAVGADILNT